MNLTLSLLSFLACSSYSECRPISGVYRGTSAQQALVEVDVWGTDSGFLLPRDWEFWIDGTFYWPFVDDDLVTRFEAIDGDNDSRCRVRKIQYKEQDGIFFESGGRCPGELCGCYDDECDEWLEEEEIVATLSMDGWMYLKFTGTHHVGERSEWFEDEVLLYQVFSGMNRWLPMEAR